MFYKLVMASCLLGLLLATPCFANTARCLVKSLSSELVKAKHPYIKKIAVDRLDADQLERFDNVLDSLDNIHSYLKVLDAMEAIKAQGDDEMYELNTFAAKFFAIFIKNMKDIDMTYSPYSRFVDSHKHLLSDEFVVEIDALAAEMREIAGQHIDMTTQEDAWSYMRINDKYIHLVLAALDDAGAIDFISIAIKATNHALQELEKKAGIERGAEDIDPDDAGEDQFYLPLNVISDLKKQRSLDLGALGEEGFKVGAHEYGFSQQEVDSLQHILDLEIKSEHLVLDYAADIITKEQFVDKMNDLLATHGEVLSEVSKYEISKQLTELH